MKQAMGIDIGGTKIAAGLVDEKGTVSFKAVVPSRPESREAMFDALCEAIDQVLAISKVSLKEITFGIGMPGLVNREAGIAVFQNNLPWENFPLAERLKQAYPEVAAIIIDNDVYQAAFAEWQALQLNNQGTMAYLTVSTGISSAIMVNGEFLRGEGFAGEVGLLPVRNSKGASVASLENTASGPALAKAGQQAYGDETIDTAAVFQRYYQGDETAKSLIEDWLYSLGHGIYALCCVVDPTKIVLGGSVLLKNPAMLPLIKAQLAKDVIPAQAPQVERIVLSAYDNDGGLIGAGLRGLVGK